MTVPKAAMNENRRPVLWKHDVGCSWEVLDMQSIAEPCLVKLVTKHEFRIRVTVSDFGHHSATDMACNDVSHELTSFFSSATSQL